MQNQILIVEDDNVTSYILTQKLKNYGYTNVCLADSYESTLKAIKKYKPALILMDININGNVDGIETVKTIHQQDAIPIIFISGTINSEEIREASAMPFCYFFYKPLDFNVFIDLVRELCEHNIIPVLK